MPSKSVIKKHWEGKFRFIEDFGWKELPTSACWKCGKDGYVEKSHIHSRCYSYDDTPSNLHLLCSKCHTESEFFYGFKPGLFYYEWFYTNELLWIRKLIHKFISGDISNSISDDITMKDLENIMKIIVDGRTKLEEEFRTTGEMIWDEKIYSKFKKLSKEKDTQFTDYMIREGVF